MNLVKYFRSQSSTAHSPLSLEDAVNHFIYLKLKFCTEKLKKLHQKGV